MNIINNFVKVYNNSIMENQIRTTLFGQFHDYIIAVMNAGSMDSLHNNYIIM